VKPILCKCITKIIYILIFINIILPIQITYSADTNEILNTQKNSFGISDFIKETEKYKGEFFEDIDIEEMLEDATSGKIDKYKIYNKILNLLGTEVKASLTGLIGILVIVVIHSILKAITDDLENKNI